MTAAGRSVHDEIEQRTDKLASLPFEGVGAERLEQLVESIDPIVDRIAAVGEIAFPIPMGLPRR